MTLEDLKKRCDAKHIPYAYGTFKEPTEPPHLVSISIGTNNFMADNKVYLKEIPIQMDYTYLDKDVDLEEIIENEILADVTWNKSDESYYSDEKYWQVSYYFSVMEVRNG